eukprot:1147590-Pelagomonas_calceolata.AAC.2
MYARAVHVWAGKERKESHLHWKVPCRPRPVCFEPSPWALSIYGGTYPPFFLYPASHSLQPHSLGLPMVLPDVGDTSFKIVLTSFTIVLTRLACMHSPVVDNSFSAPG